MNERLPDLVTNRLSQKVLASTEGYDESDKEESDTKVGAQHHEMVREAGAQQTSNRDTGV